MRPQRLVAVLHARRRPDVAGALVLAAFFLGIVAAAAAFLGLRVAGGDTVPQREHAEVLARLAAEQAARVAQGKALDDAAALERRLVAALGDPAVTAADVAELRREVASQATRIERVRVVRVPVPGPVVTVTPAAAPAPARAQAPGWPAAAPPTPAHQDTPPRCALEVLGVCVAR